MGEGRNVEDCNIKDSSQARVREVIGYNYHCAPDNGIFFVRTWTNCHTLLEICCRKICIYFELKSVTAPCTMQLCEHKYRAIAYDV
jgi:hypothetical protein